MQILPNTASHLPNSNYYDPQTILRGLGLEQKRNALLKQYIVLKTPLYTISKCLNNMNTSMFLKAPRKIN